MASAPSGLFSRCSRWSSSALGHPLAFAAALGTVILWAVLGPAFGFSDSWQLTINTGTTIVTFLMVFLIQNTQNRQGEAIQLKLDELIRAVHGAHNMLVDLEDADDEELKRIKERYRRLAEITREEVRHGREDTGSPELEGVERAGSGGGPDEGAEGPSAQGNLRGPS